MEVLIQEPIAPDLLRLRRITIGKPYKVRSNEPAVFKNGLEAYLINDDNEEPIVVYSNEIKILRP